MFFRATSHTMADDGIRVTADVKRPKANETFEPSESFHPSAFDPTQGDRVKNGIEHRKLLRREIEDQAMKISSLETALEDEQLSNVEKMASLESLVEHQENAIRFRQLHLDTALDEKDELAAKCKSLEERIKNIRSKALVRKFQSRFWMTLFILSVVEHVSRGTLLWIGKNVVMPVTTDLVFSNSYPAVIIRVSVVLGASMIYRVDKMLGRVPCLF